MWIVADRRDFALGDQMTLVQNSYAVRKRKGHVHIMLNHEDRHVLRQASYHADYANHFGGGQAGGRFIEQKHFRPRRNGEDQVDLTLFAVGDFSCGSSGNGCQTPFLQQ